MIAIIDYGVGNVFSLKCSLEQIGARAVFTSSAEEIMSADKIILPGVGAFCDAADKLRSTGMEAVVKQCALDGKLLLGICLGMQLLFDKSFEYGEHTGLGLIGGEVVDLSKSVTPGLKIPHMGWNELHLVKPEHPLFKYTNEKERVYFVHSYHAVNCESSLLATADYSLPVTAAVANGNVMGFQFHPEKSGNVGLKMLRAFCEM